MKSYLFLLLVVTASFSWAADKTCNVPADTDPVALPTMQGVLFSQNGYVSANNILNQTIANGTQYVLAADYSVLPAGETENDQNEKDRYMRYTYVVIDLSTCALTSINSGNCADVESGPMASSSTEIKALITKVCSK